MICLTAIEKYIYWRTTSSAQWLGQAARKGFLYADWRNAKWRNVCQPCRMHIRTGFTFEGSLRRIVPMIVDFFQANWITDIFDREHSHARAGSICNFFPRKFRSLSCGDRLCRHSLD